MIKPVGSCPNYKTGCTKEVYQGDIQRCCTRPGRKWRRGENSMNSAVRLWGVREEAFRSPLGSGV